MSKYFKILFVLMMVICLSTATILAADQVEINIGNVTDGAKIAGLHPINGTVSGAASVSKVAVKVGQDPWATAFGTEKWEYTINTWKIGLYGDLEVAVAAFDGDGNNLGQKTLTLKVVPETPTADINPDGQGKLSVVLKAAPDLSILYTNDGSDPTQNGFLYQEPITVDPNADVKVTARSNNNLYSEIRTLDLNSIRTLSGSPMSLDVFNGKKVYTMVTYQPAEKSELNVDARSGALTSTGATQSANQILENRNSRLVNHSATSFNNLLRQKESEILSQKIAPLKRDVTRGYEPVAPAEPVVNETQWNDVYISVAGVYIDTTCRYISDYAYFYVDNRDDISQYLADYGKAFDQIYQTNLDKFGEVWDVDGNGKVIIVFSQALLNGYLGYYNAVDQFSNSLYPASNEGDIFYVTADSKMDIYDNNGNITSSIDITAENIKTTLAHELQHMTYFDNLIDNGSDHIYTWMNEALSQAAEYYNGYLSNHLGWIQDYLTYWPDLYLSLTYWTDDSYGYSALFIRYLIDQYGGEAIKAMYSMNKSGIAAIEEATGEDFNVIFDNFSKAVVLSGTGANLDPRYRFKTLDLQAVQPEGRGGLTTPYNYNAGENIPEYELYPYELSLVAWEGTFGTMALTGEDFVGTAFGIEEYQLNVTYDPSLGFTNPRGATSVYKGVSRKITAIPNNGFKFVNWTPVLGSVTFGDPNSASTTVTCDGNASIRANFILDTNTQYILNVTNDGHGTTDPLGSVTVNNGVGRMITATPNEGYQFKNWTIISGNVKLGDANSANTTVIVRDGDAEIQANFEVARYNLTITNDGNGSTNPSRQVTLTYGESLNINAIPNNEYHFVHWIQTGGNGTATFGDSNSANTTVTVINGDATIRASFELNRYTLTVNDDGRGTTNPWGRVTVYGGISQNITASPNIGYRFDKWTVEEYDGSGTVVFDDVYSPNTTVTVTRGDVSIRANFIAEYTVTMTNDGYGTTDPTGSIKVGNWKTFHITAIPEEGYEFDYWSHEGPGIVIFNQATNEASVYVKVVDGDVVFKAHFKPLGLDLSFFNNWDGEIEYEGKLRMSNDWLNVPMQIGADQKDGYKFVNWTQKVGSEYGTGTVKFANPNSATTTVLLSGGNASIQANYVMIGVNHLTVKSGENGETTPSEVVKLHDSDKQEIAATPNPGYHFVNWTKIDGTGKVVFENTNRAKTTVTVSGGDATIQAVFAKGILGDVNEDGSVTIVDAQLVAQYVAGLNPPNFNQSLADVNRDGKIDIFDGLIIARFAAGLITEF